jgi:hypothetical protein
MGKAKEQKDRGRQAALSAPAKLEVAAKQA